MRAILMYHSVDGSGSAISISPAEFTAHVAWLASGAVRVVPLDALLDGSAPDEAVALTFDDAFTNFGQVAWPQLRAHGMPVTLYVVSGHAGGTNAWGGREARGIPTMPLMSWEQVARAADEGVTIGAHSRTHPDLRTLDAARLGDELAGSAETIAEQTGRRPTSFAYPYGAVDGRVVRAAAPTYRSACGTALRELTPDDAALELPRLDTYYLRAAGRLESWGTPGFRRYVRFRAGLRRVRAALAGGT